MSEDESSLLQEKLWHERPLAVSSDGEVDFVVSRGSLKTDAPGLAYRDSINFEDRDPAGRLSQWGSTVRAVPLSDDWVKVGTHYLPMRVDGQLVLERVAPGEVKLAVVRIARQEPQGEEEVAEAALEAAPEGEAAAEEGETAPAEAPEAAPAAPEAEEGGAGLARAAAAVSQASAAAAAVTDPVFDGVVVEFGVLITSFPVFDFQSDFFTASLLLTQRWPGTDSGDAETPWSPNLAVTNHDIGGIEVISTSTVVNKTDGMVTQFDYLTARVRQAFEFKTFPFDQQILTVRVAPASPEGVNVKMVPMNSSEVSGMNLQLFEGSSFNFVSVAVHGDLEPENVTLAEPPRGVVEVVMNRRARAYFSSLFLPALLLLGVCWAVFFIPMPDPSFAVPRVAVTATVFLAMLVFVVHVEQMVPARTGLMWIDVFTENIEVLVFASVAFSTLEQYVHTRMQRPDVASSLSRELRVLYPALSVGILSMCYGANDFALSMLSAVCRLSLAVVILGYIAGGYGRALLSAAPKPRGPVIIRAPR